MRRPGNVVLCGLLLFLYFLGVIKFNYWFSDQYSGFSVYVMFPSKEKQKGVGNDEIEETLNIYINQSGHLTQGDVHKSSEFPTGLTSFVSVNKTKSVSLDVEWYRNESLSVLSSVYSSGVVDGIASSVISVITPSTISGVTSSATVSNASSIPVLISNASSIPVPISNASATSFPTPLPTQPHTEKPIVDPLQPSTQFSLPSPIQPSTQPPLPSPTQSSTRPPQHDLRKSPSPYRTETNTRLWSKAKSFEQPLRNLFNMTHLLEKYIPLKVPSYVLAPDSKSLLSIVKNNKGRLVQRCHGHETYSFCQGHSLICWDSDSRLFYTFSPQPLPFNRSSVDLTFVAHTSYDSGIFFSIEWID